MRTFYPASSLQTTQVTLYSVEFSDTPTYENFPSIPIRAEVVETVAIILDHNVVSKIEGCTLESLAQIIYGDQSKYKFISDYNIPREPLEWREGDLVRIPIT